MVSELVALAFTSINLIHFHSSCSLLVLIQLGRHGVSRYQDDPGDTSKMRMIALYNHYQKFYVSH